MGNFNRSDRHQGGRNFNHRDSNRGNFNRGNNMHKAICDACHKNCEVPFKPTGNKPVFCSDCFNKQGSGNRRDDRNQRPKFKDNGPDNSKEILKGIKTLNYKLDELIKTLASETPTKKANNIDNITKKTLEKVTKKKTAKKLVKRKNTTAKKKSVVKKSVKKKTAKKK